MYLWHQYVLECSFLSVGGFSEFKLYRQVLAAIDTPQNGIKAATSQEIFISNTTSIPYFQLASQMDQFAYLCTDQFLYVEDNEDSESYSIVPRNYTEICTAYVEEANAYLKTYYSYNIWQVLGSLTSVLILSVCVLFVFLIIRDRRRVSIQYYLRQVINNSQEEDLSESEDDLIDHQE